MSRQRKKKIIVFIDAPALIGIQVELERALDHRLLYAELIDGCELVPSGMVYYDKPRSGKVHDFLQRNGFTVMTTCSREEDVDDELAAEMSKRYVEADIVVFVGGDHAYAEVLRQAKEDGKEVRIYCIPESLSGVYRSIADQTVDLGVLDYLTDPRRTEMWFGIKAEVFDPGWEEVNSWFVEPPTPMEEEPA